MAVSLCHVTCTEIIETLGINASDANGVTGTIVFTPQINDVFAAGSTVVVPKRVDTLVRDGQWVGAAGGAGAWFVRPDSTSRTYVYRARVELKYRPGNENYVKEFYIAVPAAGEALLAEIIAERTGPGAFITKGDKGDKGDTGATGAQGPAGQDGELVGTAGGDLQGTYPNPTLNTVTIAKGGTGATTPEGARAALGAAAAADVASYTGTADSRIIGPRTECVIAGSSNAVTGTWGTGFCLQWGLTERNYAIGGSAFTTAGSFRDQLTDAAASDDFDNNDVGLVIICDASNSIRAKQDLGTLADECFDYARSTFPNARVLMLPVIWPADPASQATEVPGGYQTDWHQWLFHEVDQMRIAARKYGVEFVESSWTWLTGHNEWMQEDDHGNPSGGVHCNAAGYDQIAYWLGQHMRGASTCASAPWAAATYMAGTQPDANLRPLSAFREGWDVRVEGGGNQALAGSGGFTDIATMPLGYRPTYTSDILARYNGQSAAKAATIYPNGIVRMWENVPAGTLLILSGSYRIG